MAQGPAVAWVQSLAWEFQHATGVAKKKKKKNLFLKVTLRVDLAIEHSRHSVYDSTYL